MEKAANNWKLGSKFQLKMTFFGFQNAGETWQVEKLGSALCAQRDVGRPGRGHFLAGFTIKNGG